MPKIRCACNRVISYGPGLAGKLVKCPGCSAKIRLPMIEPAAPPASATPDQGQELQLERDEADIPLASNAPPLGDAGPSNISLPPNEPPSWTAARRSAPATSDRAAAASDYWSALPGAFGFPLRANGLIALTVGAIFLTAVHYLMFMAVLFPLLGIVLAGGIDIVGTGYFAGYLMTIIERTAHGEKDAPGWPDLTDWRGERAEAVRLRSRARYPVHRPVRRLPAFRAARTERGDHLGPSRRGAVLHADGHAVRRAGERLRRS